MQPIGPTDSRAVRARSALAALLCVVLPLSAACAPAIPLPGAWAAPESPPRVYRVAVMTLGGPVWDGWTEGFRDGMRDLGYVEGRDLVVEDVPADSEDVQTTLATIARLRLEGVDAIVSAVLPHHLSVVAAAAAPIPMVEPLLNTPNVGAPPITSYAHPGGNLTGIIAIDVAQHARRLQLLKQVAPAVTRVIVLTPWDRPDDLPGWREIADMARFLHVDVERVQPTGPDDIEPALEGAVERGADGLLQYQGNPFGDQAVRQRIGAFAAQYHLPAVYIDQGWPKLGALMAYNTNDAANYRRAATYVDRILKGANVQDLPIEQPTTFDFVVNLNTARNLGLTVPKDVLAQASQIIE